MATLSVGGNTVFDGSATQGLTSATTFPSGHVIKMYSHTDATSAIYASGTDITPLGGTSGLRAPANGSNITTTVTNSKFWIFATVSSSWTGTSSNSYTTSPSDYGLFIHRTNVSGTTTTRIDVGTTNDSTRGGDDTWFASDDQILGYNPYDTRCFVLAKLDAPNATAGSTFYYSIGMAQRPSGGSGFAYNRIGASASTTSASTITVMEVTP